MQVRPKFLLCVAATCFFIATKLEEKPEVGITVQSFDGGWFQKIIMGGSFVGVVATPPNPPPHVVQWCEVEGGLAI